MSVALASCSSLGLEGFPQLGGDAKKPSGARQDKPAEGAAQRGTARAVQPPPPQRPPPPPIKVVGLSRPETVALLGRPARETEAPPSRIWQYRAQNCTVDIYFYFDVSRSDFYALHYGSPGGGDGDATERCLRQIQDANRRS